MVDVISSTVVLFVAEISLTATVRAEEDFDKRLCCCTQSVFSTELVLSGGGESFFC